MKQKNSFLLYHDYWHWFNLLTDEELGCLLRAIYIYEREKTISANLNEKTQLIFFMIKETLDQDKKKYEEICNRNKENAKSRWSKPTQS